MTVQVHFYGVVRELVGERVVSLDLPPEFTLGAVVDALASRCGEQMRAGLVSSWGYLQGHVRVFVDGRDARGDLTERFAPSPGPERRIDVYFVPMTEGGRD